MAKVQLGGVVTGNDREPGSGNAVRPADGLLDTSVTPQDKTGITGTVLVYSHVFPNPRNPVYGTFVYDQVQALRGLGIDVLVVAPTPWAPRWLSFIPRFKSLLAVPRRQRIGDIEVEHPRVLTFPGGNSWIEGLMYHLCCHGLVKRLSWERRVALIHSHSATPDGLAAALSGRKLKIPVVCTLHGSDVRIYPHRGRLALRFTQWVLRNSNRLIAVSRDLKDKVHSLAAVSSTVFHNGADPQQFFALSRSEARQKLGLSEERKILVFVGNLKPVKGVSFLLQALNQLERTDLELVIIGEGESKSELIEQSLQLGLDSQVRFLGCRPHGEVPLWLSAADCMVLPSLSEGLPTVVVEAMFCRTPVVATRVGGVPEIIKDGRTGLLVDPQDVAGLARAITAALDDPRCRQMAELAEMEVKDRLTWQSNARQVIGVYRQLLCWMETATVMNPVAPVDQA